MIKIFQRDAIQLIQDSNPNLIFLDPPFNIGEDYEYGDKRDDYYQWMYEVIRESCNNILKNGSLWINAPDQHVSRFHNFALQFGLKLENWCIWHYRFGQCQQNRFISSKSHVLWFSKGTPKVRMERVLEPSDRATTYDDPRIYETVKGGQRPPLDVWDFSRIQGNNKERVKDQPNQIPEKYMIRIINVCTDEGDLVIDPFCGGGTTAVVCAAMKRDCITGDISQKAVDRAIIRLAKGSVRVA